MKKHKHKLVKTALTDKGWLYQCSECTYYEIREEEKKTEKSDA